MLNNLNYICNPDNCLPWFNNFVQGFMVGETADQENILLKKEHSLRVWELARHIVAALGLESPRAEYAQLAALFHDLGRFPQYARYRTFNDQFSANHAQLSLKVIRDTGILAGLPPTAQRLIQGPVLLHNRRFLPPHLPEDIALITNIVRDADKLDIFRVMLAHFEPTAPPNGVVSLNLIPHPTKFSEIILERVQSKKLASYEDLVYINDFKLLLCSWIYDLNFPVSRQIVHERNYLPSLLGFLPPDPRITALGQQLHQDLQAWRSLESSD